MIRGIPGDIKREIGSQPDALAVAAYGKPEDAGGSLPTPSIGAAPNTVGKVAA